MTRRLPLGSWMKVTSPLPSTPRICNPQTRPANCASFSPSACGSSMTFNSFGWNGFPTSSCSTIIPTAWMSSGGPATIRMLLASSAATLSLGRVLPRESIVTKVLLMISAIRFASATLI